MQAIAEVWTTGICNVLENGKSLHDTLFTYLSQTPEVMKLRQQGEEQQALERARTIPLFHIISARPPKQPRMVGTFLKVHTRPRLAYALRCRGY